jgi:nucleotide-binding universal stress UspA family protein
MVRISESRILVPVDGSKTSTKTIEAIIENKEVFHSTLTVLHVVDVNKLTYRMIPDFQMEMIEEAAQKAGKAILHKQAEMFRDAGMKIEERLETGAPREVISKIANEEKFDLIIIGRRGGKGVIRDVLFGSTANYVLHHVACPVLLF